MSDSMTGRPAPAERVPGDTPPDRPAATPAASLASDGPVDPRASRPSVAPAAADPDLPRIAPELAPGPADNRRPAIDRPKIGDTRPAPPSAGAPAAGSDSGSPATGDSAGTGTNSGSAAGEGGGTSPGGGGGGTSRRRRGGRGRGRGSGSGPASGGGAPAGEPRQVSNSGRPAGAGAAGAKATGVAGSGRGAPARSRKATGDGATDGANREGRAPAEAPEPRDEAATEASGAGSDRDAGPSGRARRRGKERHGRPLGRYLMCVHVEPERTQIAVLEGRALVEHYVARPQDEALQIIGNIYRGRVKNVLPGMEAAFVDIGTPKNAVLYWGDVSFERDDIERQPGADRIEHLLRPGQTIVCQVTKNPIGLKGARLTQEVSLPGRFVVLVPQSNTYGISRRLDDNERRRLRRILDEVRPEGHGLIVRTAAAGASAEELRRDVLQLVAKWDEIDERARRLPAPALLYSEPHMAVRIIREELTEEHRAVLIDDPALYEIVKSYVTEFEPQLADRVELYDTTEEDLPLFERQHVHEQLHKALDRKVWLPSGGSLIVERTEALTVIDVNTGKNVGSSSLEETVFENNLEAAAEIARQLRLRDIGGIIVIDFIDMEVKANRQAVGAAFRAALARDKTPTQVYDISELGLIEMTRKRVGEGLVETLSHTCPMCNGRGIVFEEVD